MQHHLRPISELIRNQKLLALTPDATVLTACQKMREHYVGAMAIVSPEGRLLGIFTERDAIYRVIAGEKDPATTPLSEVMTRNPASLPPRELAIEALRMMHDGGFRHVPIVQNGRVVGMVSRSDFKGEERMRLEEETAMFESIR